MNISIELEGMEDVVNKLSEIADGGRLERALAAAGEIVRAEAAANCPVDSGRLRGSIVCNVEDNAALIGPTAEYGIYVEFGTGEKGNPAVAHTTKKQWRYKKGDRWYTTSGQPPQPFMRPALENNVEEIKAKFREVYSDD